MKHKPARVLMGLPTTSQAPRSTPWLEGLFNIQMPLGSSLGRQWAAEEDKTVGQKRQGIAEMAVDMDVDYLFFLSDDVVPPANVLLMLLDKIGREYPDRNGELVRADMVTGVYWTKTYPPEPYIWRGLLDGCYTDWQAGELFDVDFAGCDCVLIDVAMLKELPRPWFTHDWSWEGEAPSPLNTEDYWFYTQARRGGFRLFADTAVQCLHEDRNTGAMFGLLEDMAQAGGTPMGEPGMMIAELGAGTCSDAVHPDATLVRFDMREDVGPDVRCDIQAIPENHFGQYDIVVSRHVLEHLPKDQAHIVVGHWARLLKAGGELSINVPNVTVAFDWIARGGAPGHEGTPQGDEDVRYAWAMIYGGQSYPLDFHQNGFTAAKLKRVLGTVRGLIDITVDCVDGTNLLARARAKELIKPAAIGPFWREELDDARADRRDQGDGAERPVPTGRDGGRVAAKAPGDPARDGETDGQGGSETDGEKQEQQESRG